MNQSSGVPSGYANQTYTVEFTVPGDLDGVTISPAIIVPSSDNDDPQQIYRPVVPDNLGLIDVDYVVEAEGPERLGARGCRIVNVVWIDSPVAGGVSARLSVVDAVDGTPTQQELIANLAGLTQFYRNTPFLVPQGSMLRIDGFTNPGPTPIKVRLSIQFCKDMVEAQNAICNCDPGATGATGPTGPAGPTGPTGPAASDTRADNYTFSTAPLDFETASDVYFGFSSGAGEAAAGFAGSINAIGVLGIGAQKILCEDSQAVCLYISSTNVLTVDVFVELSIGGGVFVRTVLAFAAVIGGLPIEIALSPLTLPEGAIMRFGLRNPGGTTTLTQVTAELQIVSPPPPP